MQLVRGLHNIQASDHGCALTIGNFDGVHLGHQRVLAALVAQAKALNTVAAVMVFEPQPQELFAKENSPARLTRLRDKYTLLKKLGIERLICVNFNTEFARLDAQYFIEKLLIERLGVRHLIIGDDFRFGQHRYGDFEMLQRYGKQNNFGVTDTASYKLLDCRISSTEIRKALENDNLTEVERMLGRPYSIIGRIVHGEKNGRKFGFPTANVLLKRLVSPVAGVYVVKVQLVSGGYFGVANIGCRPTLNGVRQQLEVHIFDLNADLYGQQIEVILLKKLRAEQKFDSITELTQQISKDSEQACLYVNNINELAQG